MQSSRKSYLQIHIAVFLFGLTGLFGKFLDLNPLIIVLGRVFFSSIYVGMNLLIRKEGIRLNKNSDYGRLAILGILLAIHWVTFFASIQLSSVAIGLLTFSTFPVFVSLFKPFISKQKISRREVFFGLLTMIGITFIVPLNALGSDIFLGAVTGVVSGAVYAIFTSYNEGIVQSYQPRVVAFYEQAIATLVLLPSLFILQPSVTTTDVILLIILGTIFTGVGHTLFLSGLQNVSAYMAAIITMLEPLYAIALSYFTIGETLTVNTFIGGGIILGSVLLLSLSDKKG